MFCSVISHQFCEKRYTVFCQRIAVFAAKMGKAVKKAKGDSQAIDSCPFKCNNQEKLLFMLLEALNERYYRAIAEVTGPLNSIRI
jgi:hypothetical protein